MLEENILKLVEKQMKINSNKSIFYKNAEKFEILNDMFHFLEEEYTRILNSDMEIDINLILNNTVEMAFDFFQRSNQYILFHENDKNNLKKLYWNLLVKLKKEYSNNPLVSKKELNKIINEHHNNLIDFLIQTNGIELFNKYKLKENIPKVINEEYSAKFQLKILNLNLNSLKEPILDLGCGKNCNLVKFLRKKGFEAYGVDRVENNEEYILKKSWLEYKFKQNEWGTIISHMAFSNHFNHHNLRKDGNYEEFMIKFIKILDSLKSDGSFIYSPKLKFVEEIIKKYRANEYQILENELSVSIIKKKKILFIK